MLFTINNDSSGTFKNSYMKKYYLHILTCVLLLIFVFSSAKATISDTCWSFNIDDIDQSWAGYYTPNIADTKMYMGGFLAAGFASQALFPSKDKTVLPRNAWVGEYLCRYDRNGNYLWHLNSNTSDFRSHNERPYIASIATDKNDMIYIGGNTGKDAKIYTPDGDTTKIAYCPENFHYTYNGYIARIDSNGTIVWNGVFPGGIVKKVSADTSGNMYVLGQTRAYLHYYDGRTTTTLYKSIEEESDFFIVLDSTGKIRWHTFFTQKYTNIGGARDFGVDWQGNVYIGGVYETRVTFYSIDSTFFDSFGTNGEEYGGRLFLTKLNSKGFVEWALIGNKGRSRIESLEVDSAGNCFVAGTVSPKWGEDTYLMNADKSTYEIRSGAYLVLKISNKGIVQWESGNLDSKYGFAHDIVLRKNQISVVGYIKKDETDDNWIGSFYAKDGKDTTITLTTSEYFVVNYDTAGYIRYITQSGTKPGTLMINDNPTIDRDESGHLVSVNGSKFITHHHINFFGNKVLLTGTDGIIARIGNSPCIYNNITSVDQDIMPSEGISEKSLFGLPSKSLTNAEHIIVMSILGEKIQEINTISFESISTAFENINNGLYCVVIKYKHGYSDFKTIIVER